MTRYTAHYGSWTDPDGVILIAYSMNKRDTSTDSLRKAIQRAQEVANQIGKPVTIVGEHGTGSGYRVTTRIVNPQE